MPTWPKCGRAIGPPKPSLPVPVYGEDFSVLVRLKRMRTARGQRRVLS